MALTVPAAKSLRRRWFSWLPTFSLTR